MSGRPAGINARLVYGLPGSQPILTLLFFRKRTMTTPTPPKAPPESPIPEVPLEAPGPEGPVEVPPKPPIEDPPPQAPAEVPPPQSPPEVPPVPDQF